MTYPDSTRRVMSAASAAGLEIAVSAYPAGTKTASQAAAAVGCEVGAIVKSLVFLVDGEPVLALVPGDRRLDPVKLAQAAGGAECRRADLDRVRDATGYVAGGTPPFGHDRPIPVYADRTLARHDPVWAAAGTPTTVFPISVHDLVRLSEATWADVVESGGAHLTP